MTKPLPYGCIKLKKEVPTLNELKDLLANVTLREYKIGHLFVVDIVFAEINDKTILFNEFYPPIFEKNKKIKPYERSWSQIMSRAEIKKNKNKEDTLFSLPFNSKNHSTLKEKIYVPLYAEDLYFLTTRAGWKVTKIYEHYTFKQDTFKKDFVVMNQNTRKTAKSKVEIDFYKLLNNSNFGNDCRNNIGNCTLELIYDGPEELAYIKKFTDVFHDPKFKEFFTVGLFKKQVEDEFEQKLERLDIEDKFYPALLESITQTKDEKLEAIDAFNQRKKRKGQTYFNKKKLNFIEEQIEDSMDLRTNKMTIEFSDSESSSVKHIAIKSNTSIKCTTRFMSGKLLMFAKLSLKSFIYSLIELLSFPEENKLVQEIYNRHQIERIFVYYILTDSDSTSLQFLVVSSV